MAERIQTTVENQRVLLRDISHELRILVRNANPGLAIEIQLRQNGIHVEAS